MSQAYRAERKTSRNGWDTNVTDPELQEAYRKALEIFTRAADLAF